MQANVPQNEAFQFDYSLLCGCCSLLYSDSRRPASLKVCDNHIHCEICLLTWREKTCPLCRQSYTEQDIKIERRYLELVQTCLRTITLQNEEALRTQVREQFKDLEPSFESLIIIEKSIVDFYKEAIEKTNNSLWASGGSMALKSVATSLCFFPATVPIGLTAMGLTAVTDFGQNFFFANKKKGVYCKISEAIKRHDSILHDKKIKPCFDRYNELQKWKFVQLFMAGEAEFAQHLDSSNNNWSTGTHTGVTLLSGMQYFNMDQVEISQLVSGKTSTEWQKMPRKLSTVGTVLLVVGICAEWGFFFNEMQNGKVNKMELENKIKETEETILLYETFLQRSRGNQI